MSATRILLTGASGAIGSEVLRRLCDSDRALRVTVFTHQSGLPAGVRRRDGVTVVRGDLSRRDDVARACRDQDAVIHLAALIPPRADENPRRAWETNVTGTRNLVECLRESSPAAFLLYSSSISVYGDRIDNPWIRVTDDLRPSEGDAYAETKIEAERIVRESGLAWSIFRLTAIMGAGNHKVSGLMFHMPLATPVEIATPRDTARAFVHAIDKKDVLNGRVFNLGGGEECRIAYRDLLARSFRIFGLGELDFPEGTFATRNFHCGYYADGDDLESILAFRRDTIETYFDTVRRSVPAVQKIVTIPLAGLVKRWLLLQSDPLRARRKRDAAMCRRFFGTESVGS